MSAALPGHEAAGRSPARGRVWAWTVAVWVVLGGTMVVLAQSELIPPGPGLRPPLGGPYPGFVLTLVAGVLFVAGAPALVRGQVFERHWWKRSRAMAGVRRRALARRVRAVRPVTQDERGDAVVVARAMLYLDAQAAVAAGIAAMALGIGLHVGVVWQVAIMVVAAGALLVQATARRLAARRVRAWLDLYAPREPAQSAGPGW